MTMSQVRRILGPPNRKIWSEKFRADEYIYSRETKKDREGFATKYTNYYLFRANKLFYIELSRDALGGG